MIVGPWGEMIASLDTGAGLIIGEIDLNKLKLIRKQFPCLEHYCVEVKP